MSMVSSNRGLLLVFMAVAALSAIICGLVFWKSQQAIESYLVAKNEFSKSAGALYQKIDNNDYMVANIDEYSLAEIQGKIGVLDRIVWVDVLEKIAQELAMSEFKYELSPSTNVTASQMRYVELQLVEITLRMGFAHDGEIFSFFSALSEQITAIFEVAEIDIVRASTGSGQGRDKNLRPVKLKVVCRINWYSVLPYSPPVQTGIQAGV